MEAQDRIFYARLSLASSLAFVVFGYITILSIGLGLLFLAVVSAVLAVVFRPGRGRALVSALLIVVACVPPAWMVIALAAG